MRSHLLGRPFLAISVLCAAATMVTSGQAVPTVGLTERNLRNLARTKPLPVYPAESIQARVTGIAVVHIVVNTEGRVEKVDVLEAPDERIRHAVNEAVGNWVFTPLTAGPGSTERRRAHGKLFFYFRLNGNVGRVLFPEEAIGTTAASGQLTRPASPAPPSGAAPKAISGEPLAEVDETGLEQFVKRGPTVFVDVRDRDAFKAGHRSGSINIPLEELPARATAELSNVKCLIVDCSYESLGRCRLAGQVLRSYHSGPLAILTGR